MKFDSRFEQQDAIRDRVMDAWRRMDAARLPSGMQALGQQARSLRWDGGTTSTTGTKSTTDNPSDSIIAQMAIRIADLTTIAVALHLARRLPPAAPADPEGIQ
ncbi:MAG: hypothetical protein SGJ11_06360 [Phycisphaerae bacterium]|nr:hypothetical protein [Phycisphaerae bacterium]